MKVGTQAGRVLITTNQLHRFGGSEMVTLELAEEFVRRGWQVDVFTNFLGTPFSAEFSELQAAGVRVADDAEAFGHEQYDLIWIQHSLMPPALLHAFARGAQQIPPTVWNHMSSFEPLELPFLASIEAKTAARVLSVSPETQMALARFDIPVEKSDLFQNPAPHGFSALPSRAASPSLKRILLVSNHPPAELVDALAEVERAGGAVSRLGGSNPARLRPESFTDIDAVITIGKTVQYALSAGIPVYEYDHFGGAGWLNDANLEAEFETNFSGRTSRRTIDASQIVNELTDGFADAQSFALQHRSHHADRFGLVPQLDRILELLNDSHVIALDRAEYESWITVSLLTRNFYRGSVSTDLKLYLVENELGAVRYTLSTELSEANTQLARIQESPAYRLGGAITAPVRWTRRQWRRIRPSSASKS